MTASCAATRSTQGFRLWLSASCQRQRRTWRRGPWRPWHRPAEQHQALRREGDHRARQYLLLVLEGLVLIAEVLLLRLGSCAAHSTDWDSIEQQQRAHPSTASSCHPACRTWSAHEKSSDIETKGQECVETRGRKTCWENHCCATRTHSWRSAFMQRVNTHKIGHSLRSCTGHAHR